MKDIMKSCKSCTDINQSKKLAEILPLESADMDYIPIVNLDGEYSILAGHNTTFTAKYKHKHDTM